MIEKIFDDFYHVEQACEILSNKPFERPLISLLHCMGGESVMASRWMGLIIMMVTIIAFVQFLHSREKRQPFHFFALFHPIILFPYLYASQLSSAVTAAWAIGGMIFFFHKCRNMAWIIVSSFLLAVVGLGVRFEAPYLLIMVTGAMLVMIQSRDNLTITETIKKYFNRENIVKIAVFMTTFFLMKKLVHVYFYHASGVLKAIALSEKVTPYPLDSWYNSQVVAIFHYLKNFFFPFSHSFYGNWQEYIWVDQTFGNIFPMLIFLSLVLGLLAWSYWSRISSTSLLLIIRGTIMFVLIALVVSSIPLTEWYYPSRGHLAAMVLMGYVSVFVSRLKHEKIVSLSLATYLLGSLGYAVFFQYKNLDNMYAHDRFFYGDVHPFLRMDLADREWSKGNRKIAIQTWFNIYQRIPDDIAKTATRAGFYKLLALYYGWWAYQITGQHEKSLKLILPLLNNTYFISTAVCLQDTRVRIDVCLNDTKKIINFCEHYAHNNFPRFKQAHPFRIDIKPHCQKLGFNTFH